MFQPNVALYLRDLTFKTEDVDQEKRKIVVCSFMVQPFTKVMADSLNIARHLFSLTDGEPMPDVISSTLAIAEPLQEMQIKMAPDAPTSLKITDVRVSRTISVRRDKEGPVLAAAFTIDFRYPDGSTLLFLANAVNSQLFCTFEAQQGDMLTSAEQTEQQKPRRNQRQPKLNTEEPADAAGESANA